MFIQQDQAVLTSLTILISLLIFGVGLPALIYDRPPWIRRIREGHSRWNWYPTVAAIVLVLMATILALYMVNTPTWFRCTQDLATSSVCQTIQWARLQAHTVAGYTVIIALLLTIGLWARLRLYHTKYVVKRIGGIALGKTIRQRLSRRRVFNSLNIGKAEVESCIKDLGFIGAAVPIDGDRRLVLLTLAEFTRNNQLFDRQDQSHSLLRAFLESLLKTASADDRTNHKVAIDILETVASKANERNDYSISIVAEYLGRLGRRTITLENDELDLALWKVAQAGKTEHHARTLFEWGVFALGRGRDSTATNFIDRLQALTEESLYDESSGNLHPIYQPDFANLFIGLIAHFCAKNSDGTTGSRQEHGWQRFETTFSGFEPRDVPPLFDRATNYFTLRSDFSTADKIVEIKSTHGLRKKDAS